MLAPSDSGNINQEPYQHKSFRQYNRNNNWLMQMMSVKMETIVDWKCGNQLTHLLKLLHREATEDFSWLSPVQISHFMLTILRM